MRYTEQHADLPITIAARLPELKKRKELLEDKIQLLEFEIGQLKDCQIDAELLTKTFQDFRAIYNELPPRRANAPVTAYGSRDCHGERDVKNIGLSAWGFWKALRISSEKPGPDLTLPKLL